MGLFDSLEKGLALAKSFITPHPPNSSVPTLSPLTILHGVETLFPVPGALLQLIEESGILHLAATKPDTITSALVDSPVGLAAHILEKFSTFVDIHNRNLENGGLTQKFTLDEMLTNVMVYWTSGNVAATARIYKELLLSTSLVLGYVFIGQPQSLRIFNNKNLFF